MTENEEEWRAAFTDLRKAEEDLQRKEMEFQERKKQVQQDLHREKMEFQETKKKLQQKREELQRRQEHKEVEPVSMPRSSSSSTMDDAGPPQSLFVVVSYVCQGRQIGYFSSILQLDTEANNHEFVAHFEQQQGYPEAFRWVFSHLPSSPVGLCVPEDLCMVPDWGPFLFQKRAPLHVSIFNLWTKECKSIKPPGDPICYNHVVDMGVDIYFMGVSMGNYDPFFARYNRPKDSWETLQPFPCFDDVHITASAVWEEDTLLLTMASLGMWAYDIGTNKWYSVADGDIDSDSDSDNHSDRIEGKAVVLENTIYALAKDERFIVALSINKKKQPEGGIAFECSLIHDILVPDMEVVMYDEQFTRYNSRDLVHLGGDEFCIVHSLNTYYSPHATQPIQVTYLKLRREKPLSGTVIRRFVYNVELFQHRQFQVKLCFPLCEAKATAFKEGNRRFTFDPFPEHYYAGRPFIQRIDPPGLDVDFSSKPVTLLQLQDKDSSQDEQGHSNSIKIISVNPFGATFKQLDESDKIQEVKKKKDNDSSRINIIAEGYSIHVSNLPPDATVTQLEKSLRKFGTIKRDGINIRKNKKGKRYAIVEFETATSKQRAVEASTITIGGCQAEISERKKVC